MAWSCLRASIGLLRKNLMSKQLIKQSLLSTNGMLENEQFSVRTTSGSRGIDLKTKVGFVLSTKPGIEAIFFLPPTNNEERQATLVLELVPGDRREVSPTLKVSNHYEPNDR